MSIQKASVISRTGNRVVYQLAFLGMLVGALLASSSAYAAGFAINENSARQLGLAFAGGGAIADDGSTVWDNPAGMVLVRSTTQVSGSFIRPQFDFRNDGSVQQTPVGPIPLLPTTTGSASGGTSAIVPTVFLVRPVTERLYWGVGLNAPFGLTTEYDANWIGRYQAVKSQIITVNLNPSLAYRLSDEVFVGAGININYLDAELSNAVDFAALCGAAAGGACPNGSTPGQGEFDGFVSNSADDVSVGVNIGALWSRSEASRIGIAYRSRIRHSLTGNADFSAPSSLGGLAALGPLGSALAETFSDGRITSRVSLPDTASFSVFQRLTPDVAVSGDVTWTGWSSIPELRIDFTNPLTPTATEQLNWRDTWRVSVGVIVNLDDRWTLRGGYAYDESPVPDAVNSTPRLPDNDRQWLAFGASRRISDAVTVDFGYAHIFLKDTPFARHGATGNVLNGAFDSDANILSVQFNYGAD